MGSEAHHIKLFGVNLLTFFVSKTVSPIFTIFPKALKWSSLQKERGNLHNVFIGLTQILKLRDYE
jgi:hypothetical protein